MKTKLHLLSTLLLLATPAARSAVTFTFDYSDPSAAAMSPAARAALDVAGANMAAYFGNYNANVVYEIQTYSDPVSSNLASSGPYFGSTTPGFGNLGALGTKIVTNGATDLTGAAPDALMIINMGDWWDYSSAGANDANYWHMISVAMHEIGHGLGFLNATHAENGTTWLVNYGFATDPMAYMPMDQFMVNGIGEHVISPLFTLNQSVWDGAKTGGPGTVPATPNSGLYFSGPNGMAANGGQMIPFWSPPAFEEGSTNHHLGSYYRNALMFPYFEAAEVRDALTPVEIGILKDLGYTLVVPEPGSALLVLCAAGLVLRRRRAP